MGITIKSGREVEVMKEGGRILAEILKKLEEAVRPGITTWSLEEKARQMIKEVPIRKANRGSSISQSDIGTGAEPAFLGFKGYPAALCTSVNDEIVHAKPSDRVLNEGDLLKIDMGIFYKGFYTDSAITLFVKDWIIPRIGRQEEYLQKTRLIKTTKECLEIGISQAKIGNTIGDISSAIQKKAEKNEFSVIRDLVGHGIGRELHEEPEVPNFGVPGRGRKLEEGMTIAIEPMLTTGRPEVKENRKTLAWETVDGSYAAHFEHTIAIIKNGPIILTE